MKIEDLKVGDILIDNTTNIEYPIIATTSHGKFIINIQGTHEYILDLKDFINCTLKQKDEYIQGFRAGKYDGEIVEVRDEGNQDWRTVKLAEISVSNHLPFFDVNGYSWRYARPVKQDKRKFLEIKQ